jgi:hypothetical protein
MRNAGLDGLFQRQRVHIGQHQDLAGRGLRRHADDEAVGVEFRREIRAFLKDFFVCGGKRKRHGSARLEIRGGSNVSAGPAPD